MARKKNLTYDSCDMKKAQPGMYLGLFHGFKTEKARANATEWRATGPMIGPLEYVRTTYACDLELKFVPGAQSTHGLKNCDGLTVTEDVIKFKGMQYGDWTVFTKLSATQ